MSQEPVAFTDKLVWECPTQLPPGLIMSMRKYVGLIYETAKVNSSDPKKRNQHQQDRKNDVDDPMG